MSTESNGPIELVPFHGDQIAAIKDENGRAHVVIKRICENIGLDYSGQLTKLKSRSWATVGLCPTVAEDGKTRQLAVIPADRIPLWMATINENKVPAEFRAKLLPYQTEAADVLARHFMGEPQKPATSTLELILQQQMIANARYDGSLALLTRETAELRVEIEQIKADQLRSADQGRAVLSYVPKGYHRFYDWCQSEGIPKLGQRQPEEIHRARDISVGMSPPVPVYRCEVGSRPAAYYFTDVVLREWLRRFRRRNPGHFYQTFGFVK